MGLSNERCPTTLNPVGLLTLFVHASDTDAVHSMMAPGHASWRKRPRRVISLLPDSVYRSKFGRYESLLPAFRRTLQRWVARPSGTRPRRSPSAVADGTKRSESSSGEGRDPSGPEEQAPLTSTTETNTPPGDQDAN